MMAFILATDFDFIAYMSKMAFCRKFSRQCVFGMISMIFAVLYEILHTVTCHCNAIKLV